MNEALLAPISDKEIIDVLSQMDPKKASRIDGLSGLFYKEH